MNIFYLDPNPAEIARMLCDEHVSKMAVEAIQMLSTAHHIRGSKLDPNRIYKSAYENHPCTKWTRDTSGNYQWLCDYTEQLLIEFEYRFNKGHASWGVLDILQTSLPTRITIGDFFTPPPVTPGISALDISQSKPQATNQEVVVECYRQYYITKMERFGRFTKRPNIWV